jgi:hypothetical protein
LQYAVKLSVKPVTFVVVNAFAALNSKCSHVLNRDMLACTSLHTSGSCKAVHTNGTTAVRQSHRARFQWHDVEPGEQPRTSHSPQPWPIIQLPGAFLIEPLTVLLHVCDSVSVFLQVTERHGLFRCVQALCVQSPSHCESVPLSVRASWPTTPFLECILHRLFYCCLLSPYPSCSCPSVPVYRVPVPQYRSAPVCLQCSTLLQPAEGSWFESRPNTLKTNSLIATQKAEVPNSMGMAP